MLLAVAIDNEYNLYILTEYQENSNLEEFLHTHKSQLPLRAKVTILMQLSCALNYLHKLIPPVVHRDIKLRNVLMSSSGSATLVDFGVAKEFQSVDPSFGSNTPSTIEYMPPETLLQSMYYKESDVYAFGALMYELLTERDFAVFKSYKHIDAIVNQKYRPSLDGVCPIPELRFLIEECW